jgi:hypothetical protein
MSIFMNSLVLVALLAHRPFVAATPMDAGRVSEATQAPTANALPDDVKDSIACLFAEPWDELARLVPKRDRPMRIRFTRGALPGWENEDHPPTLNIVVYSPRRSEGVLLFAEPQSDRRILVIDNGYLVQAVTSVGSRRGERRSCHLRADWQVC